VLAQYTIAEIIGKSVRIRCGPATMIGCRTFSFTTVSYNEMGRWKSWYP